MLLINTTYYFNEIHTAIHVLTALSDQSFPPHTPHTHSSHPLLRPSTSLTLTHPHNPSQPPANLAPTYPLSLAHPHLESALLQLSLAMAYPMQRPASCMLPASVPCITPRPPLSTPAPNGAPARSTSTRLPISQPICHKAFNTPCNLLPFRRPPSAPLRRRRGLQCHVCESALSHAYNQAASKPSSPLHQ
jgi:hypothetical protein